MKRKMNSSGMKARLKFQPWQAGFSKSHKLNRLKKNNRPNSKVSSQVGDCRRWTLETRSELTPQQFRVTRETEVIPHHKWPICKPWWDRTNRSLIRQHRDFWKTLTIPISIHNWQDNNNLYNKCNSNNRSFKHLNNHIKQISNIHNKWCCIQPKSLSNSRPDSNHLTIASR